MTISSEVNSTDEQHVLDQAIACLNGKKEDQEILEEYKKLNKSLDKMDE